MRSDDANPNEKEYRNRRIVDAAKPRSMAAEEERRQDIVAVAATPAGRRFLSRFIKGEDGVIKAFQGNSRDAYCLGRHHVVEELRATLESILPRETYIEIILPSPKKEE